MKKLLLFSALLLSAICFDMMQAVAQTVVYSDGFPGSGGLTTLPGGTPTLTYLSFTGYTDASPGSNAGLQVGGTTGSTTLSDNMLSAWVSVDHTTGLTNSGHALTSASLSGYAAPFISTLSSNPELMTWSFNMRTSVAANGLGTGFNNAAVVLACTSPDFYAFGNGYAVIYNPGLPQGMQLVRFSGGLTGTITPIVTSSASLSSATDYASVNVVYESYLNQWTLKIRDDGPSAFADPSTGVTLSEGSGIDATYTSTPMTDFGFYSNYSVTYGATDAGYAYFDNFALTMSCPQIEGGTSTCVGLTTTLTNPLSGGTWTTSDASVATVSTGGVVTGVAVGSAYITYTTSSCEVYALVTVNPLPIPAAITGGGTICAGETLSLSVSPATTGATWASSNTSVATVHLLSGLVTGVSGGTAVISYIVPTGCFSTTVVTVNPNGPIAGLPFFCLGDVNIFTSPDAGGTWSTSDGTIATVDASGNVTSTGVGSATITYTMPSGCYRTMGVTVNPNPTAIIGTPTVCEGATTTLSCGPTGGDWSSSNETIASITDAGLLIGNAAGTAIITYKLPSGCQATLTITVNPTPSAVGGTLSVCIGSTTALSNTLAGGTWVSDNIFIATVDAGTGVATGVSTGVVDITYRTSAGCFRTGSLTVNPLPSVIAGTLTLCSGSTTTLSSGSGGTWSSSDATVATVDASGVVTGGTAGTANISYTLPTGCYRYATVTVVALPPAISGPSSVCTGNGASYSNTSTGGTWSSSTTAVGTIDAGSGAFTALTAGTTSIVYTATTGCSISTIVTVLASPTAITGTASVCVGQTTTLASTPTTGTWTSSNTAIATVGASTGLVTAGASAGTATITYSVANGCYVTRVVTVNAYPNAITGTATVCVGSSTLLSATPTPGTWSSSVTAVGTVNSSGSVTGIAAGTTRISYTVNGCASTRVVTVNALPTTFTGSASVCMGATVTLNSTPTTGTWTSSNTTTAPVTTGGVVTGNTTGTANITYTLPTGCYRTRVETVNPLPAAIGGPTTLCPGTSVTLTNTSTPGTWSSLTTGVATIVTGTGVLTGVTTGTSNIVYTLSTGCTDTVTVTVSPAPTAVITALGDTVLCPGDFVTLAASITPGVTYEWYNGTTAIPGATGTTYTTGTAGVYHVHVNVTSGCSSISVGKNVTVVPATATITVVGGSTVTCAGTAVTLNANTGAGLSYQWELGGVAITGATTSTYSALTAGSYDVRVTNSAGCWAISTPVVITVSPAPSSVITASGPLTFCAGNSVTFTASTGTGYTYQWHDLAGAISGATGNSYTATNSGSYYVEISSPAGCVTTSTVAAVVVNPLPDVTISHAAPLIFCAGGNVVLTAATGFNYQWYKNGTALSGATNATYLASASGNYRVRVTNATTGCSDMTHADTVVTVLSAPTSIPLTPKQFCWGGSALLGTSVSYLGSAVQYQWYFNTTAIPGATNSTYNATVAGSYYCKITAPAAGCFVVTTATAVTELPLPDPIVTFDGTSFHTGNFYVTYQWYKDLVAIGGATSSSTLATANGSYKVAVTDTNGCQSVSSAYVLTDWRGGATGINETTAGVVRVYPNPASNLLFVESNEPLHGSICSIEGKTLLETQDAKRIDISQLANGVYFLRLFNSAGEQVLVQKVLKVE